MIYLLFGLSAILIAASAYLLCRTKEFAIDQICDFMEGASLIVIGLVVALISALLRIAGIL